MHVRLTDLTYIFATSRDCNSKRGIERDCDPPPFTPQLVGRLCELNDSYTTRWPEPSQAAPPPCMQAEAVSHCPYRPL